MSIEMEIVERLVKLLKYAFTAFVVAFVIMCVSFAVSTVAVMNFLNQYEYSTETVTVDGKNGAAVYQKSDEGSNYINGEDYSKGQKNDQKK